MKHYKSGDRVSLFKGFSVESLVGHGVFVRYEETHRAYPGVFVRLDGAAEDLYVFGSTMLFVEGRGPQ